MSKPTKPRPADVARWVHDANMKRPQYIGGAALRESYTVPKQRALRGLASWGLGLDGLPKPTGSETPPCPLPTPDGLVMP